MKPDSNSKLSFEAQVNAYTKAGWQVLSDGPTGVQVVGPKKMKALDTMALVLGVGLLLFVWPVGLLFILVAIIDYAFLTKPETRFIPRNLPPVI